MAGKKKVEKWRPGPRKRPCEGEALVWCCPRCSSQLGSAWGGEGGGSRFHIWIEVQDLTNLLISSFSSKSSSSSPNGLYRVSATLGIKMESIFLLLTKMVFNTIYKYLSLVFYIIYIKVDSPQPAHVEQEFDGHEDWVVEVDLMKKRVFQSCCELLYSRTRAPKITTVHQLTY